MKRWLCLMGLLAAVWGVSRLPHPAVDVGELEPVGVVLVQWRQGLYRITTDTGATGSGGTLARAAEDLTARAAGTVFLETADHVLLTTEVPVTQELWQVFRPACRVCLASGDTDLERAAKYLAAHPPERTLNDLRAGEGALSRLEMEEGTDGAT